MIFKEIEEKGMVHINVLNTLGEMMVSAGKLAELEGLVFPLFEQYGIRKNEYTYQSMVQLLAEERRIVEVQRVWDRIHREELQPTFETICLYLEMAILESNEDRVIEALEWFLKIKRQPKNKYLKYLGELHQVPVRIHSILMEFEEKYGVVKDKVLRQRKADKYVPV